MTGSNMPEWLNETPGEREYTLETWGEMGSVDQSVQLTRGEYIALKRHLAVMRGCAIAAGSPIPQDAVAAVAGYHALACKLALQVRHAMAAGAEIEPGKWTAQSEAGPIRDWADKDYAGVVLEGLDVNRQA